MNNAHGSFRFARDDGRGADLCKYIELLLLKKNYSLEDRESIVFEQHLTLAPVSKEIEEVKKEDDRIYIKTNILNIIGLYGPMPDTYNESFLDQIRENKVELKEFLDIFHHRLMTLFYYMYQQNSPKFVEDIVYHLSPARLKLLPLNQLFFKKTKGVGEFQRLLKHLFKVNVEVKQLTGGWVYPKKNTLNQLGHKFVSLGRNAILGHRYYEPSLSVDAVIAPIEFECFFDIWKNHLKTIKRYTFFYLPLLTDVNFVFQIKEHEAKKAYLGKDLFLKINSWIVSKPHKVPAYNVKVFSKFEKAYNDLTD